MFHVNFQTLIIFICCLQFLSSACLCLILRCKYYFHARRFNELCTRPCAQLRGNIGARVSYLYRGFLRRTPSRIWSWACFRENNYRKQTHGLFLVHINNSVNNINTSKAPQISWSFRVILNDFERKSSHLYNM